MSKRRTRLEVIVQNEIEADLGAEPDLLLLKNSVGKARFVNESAGSEYFVPYGLGDGSPDLVGLLRIQTPLGGFWKTKRGTADVFVENTAPIALWFCLEVKAPGEEAEEHQLKVHAIWRRFGAFIEVVHSVGEARAALERARRLGV